MWTNIQIYLKIIEKLYQQQHPLNTSLIKMSSEIHSQHTEARSFEWIMITVQYDITTAQIMSRDTLTSCAGICNNILER